MCWVLGLPLGLLRVSLHLGLSGAVLAMFVGVPCSLPLGLPLVGLGTLALGFSGKSW